MLLTGLACKPDAVVAIGDHVYWDLRAPVGSVMLGNSPEARKLVGEFTRSAPVLGTDNERKLKLVVTPQVCELYGTDFRSTPMFFVQDDHDYFENDEATEQIVTFPPDDFMLRMARASQRLYYPEFLPDKNRPAGLPSSSAVDCPAGVSESFGTLRCGKLLEILMYDCRRHITLKGPAGVFLPETVEGWLTQRMSAPERLEVAARSPAASRIRHGKNSALSQWRPARAGRRADSAVWQTRLEPESRGHRPHRSDQHRPKSLAVGVAGHPTPNAVQPRTRSRLESAGEEWLLHH
jgi:hypothetical protein